MMRSFLIFGAVLCFGIALPFFFSWLQGDFVIFWTREGAALFHGFSSGAAFLWFAWLERPRRKRRR